GDAKALSHGQSAKHTDVRVARSRREGNFALVEWPAVVTAISTAAIALLLALPAVASFLLIRELRRAVRALEQFGETVQREVLPAVQATRGIVDQASQIAASVRGEVDGLVQ